MSLKLKAISNTFFLSLEWISTILLSFLYWIAIVKFLDPNDYGIITTSVNLMMLFASLSSLGFNTAIIKLLPEYLDKEKKGKINSLIKFSTKITLIVDLIFIILLLFFSSALFSILKITYETIWLVILGLIAFSFFNLTTSILFGYQDMRRVFKTKIIGDFIKFALSSILIFTGVYLSTSRFPFGYFGPLVGVISGFLLISLLRIDLIFFKSTSDKIDKKNVFFMYALPAFITTLSFIVFNNVPYLVLTIMKNPEVTGLFSMAMSVMSLLLVFPAIFVNASFPIISQLCVKKNGKKKQVQFINSIIRYFFFLTIPFTTFLIFFSEPIILIVSKTEYLKASQYFLILGLATIFYAFGSIFLPILYAIRKPKIYRNIMIITAVLFLILSIPFTYFFSALGLSLAYFLSTFVLMIVSYLYLIKHIPIKFPWKDFSKILFSTFIFLSINYMSKIIFKSLFIKIIIIFFTGIFYIFTLIPLKFYKKDDIELLNHISKKLPKFFKGILQYINKIIT
jgi:O-antigen/teichoic acid export membrane protein